ncbi:MAG: Preprotein translocase subunit SecD [Candidatus Nomurabacteria bacterium GW2011_GWA2_41_25]|uniref:Protein translocase subunit SecD n=3 Tax=Candidatus Nomuraibacteriota TaxID=1752729 RepID=A0A1F6YBJ5_9BACT|nr:MAG: Preprotein translocase subunit SecD [Candidatus Nomurabacteria bacterium GW2011_GWA2_41_25]OGI80377.1 MAG: protein-export membrane protein SecD [Candidatus Nomurabacteria bacterium RIFCSPHIGHO2_02_FULL_41_52]OGI85346.1 MAG: protein-export membrane protein SecD [Candidatus Nomurabacteria bacterium RIFCSPHIGHO2_12_FULL_42_19]OGI93956.1 MAG: protein-export membrane protein SecD [Candidatus Nomurabacteria bacterium RIFCSPLOWO2_01_FULL_41_52]OGI99831.1 MAG: protein-export membrane protein Se
MIKKLILSVVMLLLGTGVAFFVFKSEPKLNKNFETQKSFFKNHPFRLGLDLSGGSHLIYKADTSLVPAGQVGDSMSALRDVIERRINIFGVSEPVVQVQHGGFVSGGGEQLIVDLPGVTDVKQAIDMIGQTPLLEFKTEAPKDTPQTATVDKDGKVTLDVNSQFVSTELTGRYLQKATLEFDANTREPQVNLQFNDVGTKLFAQITKDNVGKMVAIYLDGAPISTPVVREEIPNGQAVISGSFTPTEAKTLVGRLNSGALPVPIALLSTQTIGAILGDNAVNAGVKAAFVGFLLVVLFLILLYRLPGLIAALSLCIFISVILALFKLLPVTLTAAGIAGFIISIGIAVDANVLIFERVKEELRSGRSIADAVSTGFSRAWFSIRDSNISNFITALILFWFGTSLIKGFALTLGMGVIVSMFSAITITRIFLSALVFMGEGKVARFLFSSGISK